MPHRKHSPEYKLRIVQQYERLDRAGRRKLLQEEGLYPAQVSQWAARMTSGALAALARAPGRPSSPDTSELQELRREVRQLRAQLATAEKIIETQGNLSALLAPPATGSARRSGREL